MRKPGLRPTPGGHVSSRAAAGPQGTPWFAALGALALGALAVLAPSARAEAPYFYDALGSHVLYDPEFYPMNWSGSMLSIMGQDWKRPDPPGAPRQAWSNQNDYGEYRLEWWVSPDPAYSLKVELKGATAANVVDADYFLASEFFYHGLETPLFVYGGIRVPEEGDFSVYGGVESLSYRLSDMFKDMEQDIPVAFRGFGEIHYTMEDQNPSLRLQTMAHTLPEWGIRSVTLSAAMDMTFQEEAKPRFELQGHAEWFFYEAFVRAGLITGYSVNVAHDGEQRFAAGIRLELF